MDKGRWAQVRKTDPKEWDVEELGLSPKQEASLKKIKLIAMGLDRGLDLPFGISLGADSLIGLVPAAGDVFTALLALAIPAMAGKIGVPFQVVSRMYTNILGDALVGSVPAVGDIADAAFKANANNFKLAFSFFAEHPQGLSEEMMRKMEFQHANTPLARFHTWNSKQAFHERQASYVASLKERASTAFSKRELKNIEGQGTPEERVKKIEELLVKKMAESREKAMAGNEKASDKLDVEIQALIDEANKVLGKKSKRAEERAREEAAAEA